MLQILKIIQKISEISFIIGVGFINFNFVTPYRRSSYSKSNKKYLRTNRILDVVFILYQTLFTIGFISILIKTLFWS